MNTLVCGSLRTGVLPAAFPGAVFLRCDPGACGPVAALFLLALTAALSTTPVLAAMSGATASAFAQGNNVTDSKTGAAVGVQVGAAQTVPSAAGDAFVSVEASSGSASLGMAGNARSSGAPGGFQASASATWADSFTILAPGMAAGATGTFSGAVEVSGELSFSFIGRVYADTSVGATVDLFPGTGFNGGRTVVTSGARRFGGYDIADGGFGTERFSLVFRDVPFTFGQRIDIGLSMTMVAGINIIDAGATGRADAAYGHTLTWGGLSEVRDAVGQRVVDYSAPSQTFDFNYAPVPEPHAALLLMAGLAGIASVLGRRPTSPTADWCPTAGVSAAAPETA